MRLLLAEDEKELSNALVAILKHNHYSIDAVYDGEEAYSYATLQEYDGIILDIMMPKKTGLEVLKLLREEKIQTPILLLTAKSQLEDKVLGLDIGADDYLTKPFEMEELLARVRALTRRKSEFQPNIVTFSNVTLNRETFELLGDLGSVRLSNKEFQMLEMLINNKNRLISVEQFMEQIWGYDTDSEINVCWVYISYLRKKLVTVGAKVSIKAARGIGYSLEVENDV